MTQPSPTDDLEARITEALRIGAATGADGGLKYPSNVYVILRDTLAALRPAGVGGAVDPRYEVDVQYEVWCGPNMEAASDDLNEARRYEAQYQPCSLLKATTYRQPVGLPDAHTALRPAGGGELEQFERWIETLRTDVIQDEYGYEDGEFSVDPDHWHPLWKEGLTPSAAFARALTAHRDATPAHPDAALMERVRTVLEPFAKAGDLFDAHDYVNRDACIYRPAAGDDYSLDSGHLLEARALLSDLKAEAGTEPPAQGEG